MKRIIYLPIIMMVVSFIFSSNTFSQAVREGNLIIDPYYGGPNFGKTFFSAVESANQGANNVETSGIGPAGLRIEYLLGDRLGLGIDAIYNSNNISFTAKDTITDENGNDEIQTNQYDYEMKRLRVHVRLNWHFNITNPDLDGYFGVGAGTNNRFRNTYQNGTKTDDDNLSNLTLFPVSARLCLGTRYYFTDNLGLNLELGLGGPVVSGGLSLRL